MFREKNKKFYLLFKIKNCIELYNQNKKIIENAYLLLNCPLIILILSI